MYRTNGNEHIDSLQSWWIASRFTEQINTCDVLFCGGKIKLDGFFPARKAIDERWEVVRRRQRRYRTNMVLWYLDIHNIRSQGFSWTSHRFGRAFPLTPPHVCLFSHIQFYFSFSDFCILFLFFSPDWMWLRFKKWPPRKKENSNRQKLCSLLLLEKLFPYLHL